SAIGFHNVEFRKGHIQDLALDVEVLDAALQANPVCGADPALAGQIRASELRRTRPMIPDAHVDVVVSNCVLNLVETRSKTQLFHEIFRVIKPSGRAVISDIVSSQPVPIEMQ